jgi:ribonuclease P protein component
MLSLPSHATPPMEPKSLETDARPAAAGEAFGRLRRRAEFQRVSRGRRKSAEAFTLQSARREDGEPAFGGARVGFTATRKVGNAVERNRIRRRLKEALRAARPLEARDDHDYVVMARREALARPFAALVADLREAFHAIERSDKDGRRPAAPKTPTGRDRRS